jgi:hypothetical protein
MDAYTEICLGLTEWTTGYQVAFANYYRNMIAPWAELRFAEQDLVEPQTPSPCGSESRGHRRASSSELRQPTGASPGITLDENNEWDRRKCLLRSRCFTVVSRRERKMTSRRWSNNHSGQHRTRRYPWHYLTN